MQRPNPYSSGKMAVPFSFSNWSWVSPSLTQPTSLNMPPELEQTVWRERGDQQQGRLQPDHEALNAKYLYFFSWLLKTIQKLLTEYGLIGSGAWGILSGTKNKGKEASKSLYSLSIRPGLGNGAEWKQRHNKVKLIGSGQWEEINGSN